MGSGILGGVTKFSVSSRSRRAEKEKTSKGGMNEDATLAKQPSDNLIVLWKVWMRFLLESCMAVMYLSHVILGC